MIFSILYKYVAILLKQFLFLLWPRVCNAPPVAMTTFTVTFVVGGAELRAPGVAALPAAGVAVLPAPGVAALPAATVTVVEPVAKKMPKKRPRQPSTTPPRRLLGPQQPNTEPPRQLLGPQQPITVPPRRLLGPRPPPYAPSAEVRALAGPQRVPPRYMF